VAKWIGMTIAPAVTGRSLLESPSTQVRSLEGRPLGMSSSLMLPESSRLRLLELGQSSVTALAGTAATDDRTHELREQGQMTWIEQEHGWVAASEEIVMAPSKEVSKNAGGRAVCDKGVIHARHRGLGVLVTRP
jgi:hypothetical protein